jgi:hypothetical protein
VYSIILIAQKPVKAKNVSMMLTKPVNMNRPRCIKCPGNTLPYPRTPGKSRMSLARYPVFVVAM